ncbi:FecCD family ABC transporter permease [Wukongibacter sp. M2B1]|uniref:FecCD family ABC transporter permease n=1 Tax=Wukongibacter sp. M2B1 TaxID=3088895 RepID=UPI003D7996D2
MKTLSKEEMPNQEMDKSYKKLVILALLPIVGLFVSLCIGRYFVEPLAVSKIIYSKIFSLSKTWSDIEETVVLNVRLPRIILAMFIGGGLSACGTVNQGMFGNPLVSPHILGVSYGAGMGAALGILLSGNMATIQLLSIAFGILAMIMTYAISKKNGSRNLFMLVLGGIIVGAFFQALISLLKYVADPEEKLPTIVYWLMGSMAGTSWNDLKIGIPLISAGMVVFIILRWKINVLSLHEDEAKSLGINVNRMRGIIIIATTIITATSVSLCGIIGWIGLVIPHLSRMLVGNNHRMLIPASFFFGSFYLLVIDDIARSLTAAEIPLSILTAIVGAPFFTYLLRKTGGNWNAS